MKRIHNDRMPFPWSYNLSYVSITRVFIRIPEPSATQRNPYIIVLHFPSMQVSVPGHKKHRNRKTAGGGDFTYKCKGEIVENMRYDVNHSPRKKQKSAYNESREKPSACMKFENPQVTWKKTSKETSSQPFSHKNRKYHEIENITRGSEYRER